MTQPAAARPDTAHHTLVPHEVVLLLETDLHHGLSQEEAEARLQRFGHNVLPQAKNAGLMMRWLRQFHHPLIYILLVAGAVTGLLGAVVDAVVIFAVVLVNAVVGGAGGGRRQGARRPAVGPAGRVAGR